MEGKKILLTLPGGRRLTAGEIRGTWVGITAPGGRVLGEF
jgi:hypothetical protein